MTDFAKKYKMNDTDILRFKVEWRNTIAMTQYLLMIRGIQTIPIVSDGGKNRK